MDVPQGKLPCCNCERLISGDEAHIYAEIWVCSECNTIARRFEEQILRELKYLVLLTRESIKEKLLAKGLHFAPASDTRDVPKKELLEQMVQMITHHIEKLSR
jgi:hypothetical protein